MHQYDVTNLINSDLFLPCLPLILTASDPHNLRYQATANGDLFAIPFMADDKIRVENFILYTLSSD